MSKEVRTVEEALGCGVLFVVVLVSYINTMKESEPDAPLHGQEVRG